MYLKEILWVRAVTFATPNHITLGEGFLILIKFEHKSHTPLLFGFSHSMHGTFQVMNFPTYMELRMFESCFHMVLYFKGWITPPLHPGNSVVWNISQRQNNYHDERFMHGACTKVWPHINSNKTFTSLDNWLLHIWVIKQGIENTWGIRGCENKSSLNNSTTVSIAAGGGVKSIGLSCVCNSNQ